MNTISRKMVVDGSVSRKACKWRVGLGIMDVASATKPRWVLESPRTWWVESFRNLFQWGDTVIFFRRYPMKKKKNWKKWKEWYNWKTQHKLSHPIKIYFMFHIAFITPYIEKHCKGNFRNNTDKSQIIKQVYYKPIKPTCHQDIHSWVSWE